MRFRDRSHAKYEDDDEKPPAEVGLRDRIVHFTWYVMRQGHSNDELTISQAMVRVHHVYRIASCRSRQHAEQIYRPTDHRQGGLHLRSRPLYHLQPVHVRAIRTGPSQAPRIATPSSRRSFLRHVLGVRRPHTQLHIHLWQSVDRSMAHKSARGHVLDVLCRSLPRRHYPVFPLLPSRAP
jgi:hypothetical protein